MPATDNHSTVNSGDIKTEVTARDGVTTEENTVSRTRSSNFVTRLIGQSITPSTAERNDKTNGRTRTPSVGSVVIGGVLLSNSFYILGRNLFRKPNWPVYPAATVQPDIMSCSSGISDNPSGGCSEHFFLSQEGLQYPSDLDGLTVRDPIHCTPVQYPNYHR